MLLKIVDYFMLVSAVTQGIIVRQYGYVHDGRVEGSACSREPRTSTGWVLVRGLSGRDKITDNRGYSYFGVSWGVVQRY
jgi:hypothetical protein